MGGISEENRLKIESISKKFKVKTQLNFIRYSNLEEILGIEIKATRALSTYARLFVASLLDDKIDKILYLDCDAIVADSLKELWDLHIDDYYCAAVLDACPKYINLFLDLPDGQEHFNAGLLLINLKSWRENNLEKQFLDLIISKNGEVFHNDQGVINVVCRDKILKLNPKYNLLSPFFEVGYEKVLQWYDMKEYYSKDIIENALSNPVFIHLTTFVNGRPWFKNAQNHPLRRIFEDYVQETPFKHEIYIDDNRQFKGKFFSFAYRFLPYSLICAMFRIYEAVLIKRGKG
ncbi:MAG: glycosyltransferase family 8 protein [Methanobrevibacter thaueri]|nr:glycosyltransferase family 8 protein [Methanobrevibacter thaueri]